MKSLSCSVKTLKSLEEVLAKELEAMDFANIQTRKRAVEFETDLKGLYKANLNLRTGMSVLLNLEKFRFRDQKDIYNKVLEIKWEDYFDVKQTFMIQSTVYSNLFTNTLYPSMLVKDAIADRFRKVYGKRPNIDKERPDVVVDLYISDNFCIVSLNASGQPLFKRGYRNMPFPVPLNECLAAGMIYLSGWDAKSDFIDPMCGSGTLLIEAAMMAYKIEPSYLREEFAFKNWKNFDSALYDEVRASLEKNRNKEFKHRILGSDNSNRAISITRQSLTLLRLEEKVELQKIDFHKLKPEGQSGVIILNPPYGERLETDDLASDFKEIGDSLKFNFSNFEAWVIGPDTGEIKFIGLKPFKKVDLVNGKIPCKFNGFSLYKGSKKAS